MPCMMVMDICVSVGVRWDVGCSPAPFSAGMLYSRCSLLAVGGWGWGGGILSPLSGTLTGFSLKLGKLAFAMALQVVTVDCWSD